MKATEQFKETIKVYLEKRAMEDEFFANFYRNPEKNIDDCILYIFNTVKETQCNGFTDDEIYGMAVHYYEEPDIKPGPELKDMQVIVNHKVELSPEEIEEEKKKIREKLFHEIRDEMKKPKTNKTIIKKEEEKILENGQTSLF